ncbi:MAG: DNA polymerase III subunit gamma/tau [Cytophagales bacterium]|nr:DNA polymerase III subunit gamma/tau [Cytophagales bacterium]
MDNFVVSARKYRPATFDTVVGQAHITTTLKNAIKKNHLAQAFLFCGPRGVGKTTCARILAKTINCTDLTNDYEACGKCHSCSSFLSNASFNIHELDAASNNSVDDIRNLVDQVRYPPQDGKYKIYIIDEVHMLSSQAFNAFLKTLEEPPKYAIFILATTEKNKIIPTILSRCQIFDFNRIQSQDISAHLAKIAQNENIKYDDEALRLIAIKSDGGLRDALSMFDRLSTYALEGTLTYKIVIDNLHILDYEYFFAITNHLHIGNLPDTLVLFDEILQKGFDGHHFLLGLMDHLRNVMICKDPATTKLIQVSESIQKRYAEQTSELSMNFLINALNICNIFDINYKNSKNQRLHIELALMKIANISHQLKFTTSLTELEELKKKLN